MWESVSLGLCLGLFWDFLNFGVFLSSPAESFSELIKLYANFEGKCNVMVNLKELKKDMTKELNDTLQHDMLVCFLVLTMLFSFGVSSAK